MEEDDRIDKYREEYNDDTFWTELTDRLAERDFIKYYGKTVYAKMSHEERFEKFGDFEQKYADEFYKHGIDNL